MRVLKVGVVGSRRRNTEEDKKTILDGLRYLLEKKDIIIHLISGGCPIGADKFAEELAEAFQLKITIHHPDRDSLPLNPQYHDYVKMFHDRNTLIAEECHILLALVASDRKGGTEDTVKKVAKLGKPVVIL